MRRLANSDLTSELSIENGVGHLVVEALSAEGAYRNFLTLEANVANPQGQTQTITVNQTGPGVYVVPGTLELGALDTLLGASFVEETECTTVAGAVVELFGRLPMTGERIEHRGVAVEVLESDRRRVQRLRLRVLNPPAPKANGHGKQSGSAVA
jgi:hypothetical protein